LPCCRSRVRVSSPAPYKPLLVLDLQGLFLGPTVCGLNLIALLVADYRGSRWLKRAVRSGIRENEAPRRPRGPLRGWIQAQQGCSRPSGRLGKGREAAKPAKRLDLLTLDTVGRGRLSVARGEREAATFVRTPVSENSCICSGVMQNGCQHPSCLAMHVSYRAAPHLT
jgi:hypothetical protein